MAAGAVVLLAVAAAGLFAVSADAAVAQAPSGGQPTITGLQVGQTLVANPGTWNGETPVSFTYQWVINEGDGWSPIPGAVGQTYTVTPADIGHNLFVQVKAINAAGYAWGDSVTTSFVGGPTAASDATTLAGGQVSISAGDVVGPNRLVVASTTFAPNSLSSSGSVTAQVHVQDVYGDAVSGATVYVVGLPFGVLKPLATTTTDQDGIATVTITAAARLAGMHLGALALMVRASKPGDHILTGVTGWRLVKLPVG